MEVQEMTGREIKPITMRETATTLLVVWLVITIVGSILL